MRQIKFRAWDEKNKKISIVEKINFLTGEIDTELCLDNENELIIMQFTGLLDKNGKEIYEGDIVSTSFWYHGSEKTEFIEKPLIGQVQYWGECHGSYNLLDKTGGSIPIEWACHKNDGWKIYGEIIGNIYENPTLLK